MFANFKNPLTVLVFHRGNCPNVFYKQAVPFNFAKSLEKPFTAVFLNKAAGWRTFEHL